MNYLRLAMAATAILLVQAGHATSTSHRGTGIVLPALPVVATAGTDAAHAGASTLLPAPPMGWNSWDAYGFTIDEEQFKANASVLAGLKGVGRGSCFWVEFPKIDMLAEPDLDSVTAAEQEG